MKTLKKVVKFLQKKSFIVYTAIALAIVFFTAFSIYPKLYTQNQKEQIAYKGVLQIWNIDSFEGGKGSRTSFLQGVARHLEEQEQGLFVLVVSHSVESAKTALKNGERPDLLSFGTGCDFVLDIASPLENLTYRAAMVNGATYAYPWAVGRYFLLSLQESFEELTAENTILSLPKNALTAVAAASMGLIGNYTMQESTTAYNSFLQKKYRYLFGTQRDIARLASRNIQFYTKPVDSFSNLQQYIAITTADKTKKAVCQRYVDYLLSPEVQQKVQQIGMLSLQNDIYTAENALHIAEQTDPQWTISPFLHAERLQELTTLALQVLNGDKNQAQNLQKFYILYL